MSVRKLIRKCWKAIGGVDTKRIGSFKDIHLGKRCFIIGNGPSLLTSDLDRLVHEYTFASNKIYIAFQSTDWRPTYYSVEDSLVLEQNCAEINRLTGVIKIMPSFAYKYCGNDANTIYYKAPPIEDVELYMQSVEFPWFSHDAAECIYWGSTIIYTQIQLAAYMGFRAIYLVGVDHSYITPKTLQNDSFYISAGEVNHFSPAYRKVGEMWNKPQLDILERSYVRARDVCLAKGITVYNASRRTKLDVFERIDFDAIAG